jgi:CHAD domain-containing protein
MPAFFSPREFALQHLDVVRKYWSGVRDTDEASIHEARVALRRVRAALGVIAAPDSDEIKLCRFLGRELGRVRELDVTQELLANVGTRLPAAACAVAVVRRDVGQARQRAARRLVKALDEVKLRPLARLRRARHLRVVIFWKDWRVALPGELARRAHALRGAIDAAPATYMPNRLHRVRIAMKKLRYTLEVAGAAGLAIDRSLMRDLRKSQELLGAIHDLQAAERAVEAVRESSKMIASEIAMLDAVITADRAALHSKYLSRRDTLRAASDRVAALGASRPAAWTVQLMVRALPAVGLVAAPIALWNFSAAGAEGSHA